MPDWLTHAFAGWILGKTAKINIPLIVIGSLIPDLVKINLAFLWTGIDHFHMFEPLHTPVGAILVAGIGCLMFENAKKAFIPLGIGIISHFFLDFFLEHVAGGTRLFFPFSWNQYNYSLVRIDNYWMTVVAVVAALIVYLVYWYKDYKLKKDESQKDSL